jgi:hypothetical protein
MTGVIPVYPVRPGNPQSTSTSSSQGTSQHHHPHSHHQFNAFKLGKFRSNVSWKVCSALLLLLVLILMGFVVYLGCEFFRKYDANSFKSLHVYQL